MVVQCLRRNQFEWELHLGEADGPNGSEEGDLLETREGAFLPP
uniref:Uncharacterized protein n=1 Tax=Anguilla anguilla TaxID=7936 RepID=A0A0E9S0G3_ANGAN